MARLIGKCLGAVVMLGPLAAMLAMIVYGVPPLFPRVIIPGWSGGDVAANSRESLAATSADGLTNQAGDSDRPQRLARPLPATSRRTRGDQSMVAVRSTRTTWNHVRVALAAHGVERFKIQPGSRAGDVHFSCVQPVPGRVRVVRRFEAEADDPVRAARDVLIQIEQFDRTVSRVVRAR